MRTLTVVPELTNVEGEDSAPNAGRFGSVPKGGDASALANDRPRAVLSVRAPQCASGATRPRAAIAKVRLSKTNLQLAVSQLVRPVSQVSPVSRFILVRRSLVKPLKFRRI